MISVLVITYNSENTISRCIDSILCQSMADFELIIINDGSTDETINILRQYSCQDSRIKLFSRENRGVSISRQEALDLAIGEYTIFVDSDDWVSPDFLESLLNCARTTNADMVICDMLVVRRSKTEYLCERPISLSPDIILGQMIKELHGSLCNKLISKSAYVRTGVRFYPDLNCCEDQYVVIALLAQNISVAYLNRALYYYDKTANNDSITSNWLEYPVKNRISFIKSIEPFITTSFQKQAYANYIGYLAYTATASPKKACPNYRKLFIEYKPYICASRIPMHKKAISLIRMCGIPVPTRLVKMIRRYIQNKRNL